MPRYDWECVICGTREITIHKIEDMDIPPEGQLSDTSCEHKWERVLLGAPKKTYAPGWGMNRKGKYNSQS